MTESTGESTSRIEPALLDDVPEALADVIADVAAESAALAKALHPRTAASLADLVRIMNAYYSNLIEGHDTRPLDIERALRDDLDTNPERRNLQLEAVAHVRLQRDIDVRAAAGDLPEPASTAFIESLHREFYRDARPDMLLVRGRGAVAYAMTPGHLRTEAAQDNLVGRHQPPSSPNVAAFMTYFETRYRFDGLGRAGRIAAIAAAHHRLNYIHPFPDGNGRVSRLMSHAMGHAAGIGAHGLWSISRGLARGLESSAEYMRMMDATDAPRRNNVDGRGDLSRHALIEFTLWFLRVCLDQIRFMRERFELTSLERRLRRLVANHDRLAPEAAELLVHAAARGEFERGDASRIAGLPERSARRVLADTIALGLIDSTTPKGPVSLRFPAASASELFPGVF